MNMQLSHDIEADLAADHHRQLRSEADLARLARSAPTRSPVHPRRLAAGVLRWLLAKVEGEPHARPAVRGA
jgi:hypothetical protein